jgi:hypothetical protein
MEGLVWNFLPCLNDIIAYTYGLKLFGASLTGVDTRTGGVSAKLGSEEAPLLMGSRLWSDMVHGSVFWGINPISEVVEVVDG